MAVRIQLRGDSAANWTNTNPVLAAREIGIETNTRKMKIGDGVTAWNSLAYTAGGSVGGPVSWDDITDKPTTLDTFGITDAAYAANDGQTITLGSLEFYDVARDMHVPFSLVDGTLTQADPDQGDITFWSSLNFVPSYYQPYHPNLDALTSIGTVNRFYYWLGEGSWAPVTIGSGLSFSSGTLSSSGGGGTPGGSTTQLQYNNAGAFGGTSQIVYAGGVGTTHLTITAVSAGSKPLLIKGATSQTGDYLQVQDSGGNRRAAIAPVSFNFPGLGNTDAIQFAIRPGNRSYFFTTYDGGGSLVFGREDSDNGFFVSPNSTAAIFGCTKSSAVLAIHGGNDSRTVVIAGSIAGNNSMVDLNRRYNDDSTGVGGTVRLWVRSSQTENALEVLAPGGGSVRSALKVDGSFQPPSLADSAATNNSIYYSTTQSKLVYKDSGGSVNVLY
jgi:hypothetical protein